MASTMTSAALLRLRISLSAAPLRCEWALLAAGQATLAGEDLLADLPRGASRVEVVIAAPDVLLTSRTLPAAARHNEALLAYAVEEVTSTDPELSQVHWLGKLPDATDALAVFDKPGLQRWKTALAAAGIASFELRCEILLLPWSPQHWSLAWNGEEGFIRTGATEGTATDCGDRENPPLALQMLVRCAARSETLPAALRIFPQPASALPDTAAWSARLGLPVHAEPPWQWHMAAVDDGPGLVQTRQRWHLFSTVLPRLRPALWMLGAALVAHAMALGLSWNSLEATQQELRAAMESRFRSLFPDAVAVVDPVLQLRRQLTTARRNAGQQDGNDFLPMLEAVAAALATPGDLDAAALPSGGQAAVTPMPPGALRAVEYQSGRMTLEFSATAADSLSPLQQRLRSAAYRAETAPAAADGPRAGPLILVVRGN